MVILLSAFNGIEHMIEKLYTEFDAPLTIEHQHRKTFLLTEVPMAELKGLAGVAALSPELEELVVLRKERRWINATLHAVDPTFFKYTKLNKHLMNAVGIDSWKQGNTAYLGLDLFQKLHLTLGSDFHTIQLYAPKRNVKMRLGRSPFHMETLPISGAINYNQEVNASALLWDYKRASQLFDYHGSCTRLNVFLAPTTDPVALQKKLMERLGPEFNVKTQLEKNELIFKTSRSERLVVFIILLFVFVLASFNLVATLTMLYIEKQDNLHVLRAIGMSEKHVFYIFFLEGLLLSVLGIITGLVLGLLLCASQIYGQWLIVPGANVPFPIQFKLTDFATILLSASSLAFLFSYFPVRFLFSRSLKAKH
ncbi:MAG: hypothetical protein RLZZ301_164 [Bacteroidota bacterium]